MEWITYPDSEFGNGWISFRKEVLSIIVIFLLFPWFIFILYNIILSNW